MGGLADCLLQVSAEACNDPIALKDVQIPDDILACLEACWAGSGPGGALRHALYRQPEDWVNLVRQVLRLDIRSLHQRTSMQGKQSSGQSLALSDPCLRTEGSEHQQRMGSSHGPAGDGHADTLRHARANDQAHSQGQTTSEQARPVMCGSDTGRYSVTLHGVTVLYDILTDSTVLVNGATVR